MVTDSRALICSAPVSYTHLIRLWRAKAFLTHGMPAAEVAIAVGLTDQSHLTRAFTLRYGITLVRYQKQVARR